MVNENTAAQVKAQLIQRINALKSEAIFYGFDWPIQSLETAELTELLEFHEEIKSYILDAIIEEFERAENV